MAHWRFLILDNYYPSFLTDFYERNPDLQFASYSKQHAAILAESFGTADYYSKNLKALGHLAEEVVINNQVGQRQWAREHDLGAKTVLEDLVATIPFVRRFAQVAGSARLAMAQVKAIKPDILYIQCIGALPPFVVREMKKHCRLLVGQIASKLPPKSFFEPYDLVLSSLPNMVEIFRHWGIKSEYFAIGFESTVLERITSTKKIYTVTHVGGYGPIHAERNTILEHVAREVPVEFWGYGTNSLSSDSPIKKTHQGEAWGLAMYQILAQSKISLTSHIRIVAGNYANNMTLFEATGCGSLLITDAKKNLADLFVPNKEIVTFSSPEELVKKIRYYMSHDSETKAISLAGQKRTLKDHSYIARMKQLETIITPLMKSR